MLYVIFIYTTIGGLSPESVFTNLTKIYPCAPNSTAITAYIFLRIHLANPLPLDRSLFAFVLCFYDKKSSKNHKCGESVSIGVIDEVLSANDDPNTRRVFLNRTVFDDKPTFGFVLTALFLNVHLPLLVSQFEIEIREQPHKYR